MSNGPGEPVRAVLAVAAGLLAGGGRVLFIDEHVDDRGKEDYVPGQEEVVQRQLADGSTFRVIKNFVEPEDLVLRLRRMGWDCVIRRVSSRWVYGEALCRGNAACSRPGHQHGAAGCVPVGGQRASPTTAPDSVLAGPSKP